MDSGSHLLSHTVSSIVPSAAQVLTIVFGMRTGVSPKRIATGNIVSAILQSVRAVFPLFADTSYLAHRVKPSYRTVCSFLSVQASLPIQSLASISALTP